MCPHGNREKKEHPMPRAFFLKTTLYPELAGKVSGSDGAPCSAHSRSCRIHTPILGIISHHLRINCIRRTTAETVHRTCSVRSIRPGSRLCKGSVSTEVGVAIGTGAAIKDFCLRLGTIKVRLNGRILTLRASG